jgi:hypothetical protein
MHGAGNCTAPTAQPPAAGQPPSTPPPSLQAVIHCEIIRQAARVVSMDRDRLRSGDRAAVRFRFLQRPEYITPGSRCVCGERAVESQQAPACATLEPYSVQHGHCAAAVAAAA